MTGSSEPIDLGRNNAVRDDSRHARFPGGSRGLSVEAAIWVPTFPTDQVRGLKAHEMVTINEKTLYESHDVGLGLHPRVFSYKRFESRQPDAPENCN
jgi:hypothetical protein